MPDRIGNEAIGKVKLHLKEVAVLSLKNIRRRFARVAIIIVTIVLGTSFLTFLTMTSTVFSQNAEAAISVEAYQYWLVFISLLLCVVSITNSMTISVYERYKEIGIIKCLGALNRHVLLLFFMESAIMGLAGGILGFTCGSITVIAVSGLQLGFNAILNVPLLELLTCFGLTVTVAFGVSIGASMYPAYKAAKSKPAEAFRVEV